MKAFLRTLAIQGAGLLGLFVALSLLAAAADHAGPGRRHGDALRVVLFVNGTLGDKSFFDSAARGLRQARDTLGVAARVVEGGTDPTRWQAALTDLADSGDYDLIIAGTYTMMPYVTALASAYPGARFVMFDAAVDAAACGCRNIHAVVFRQNEGAYLAGVLSASLVDSGMGELPAHSSLGVVGGMQFPVVEDFVVGFRAGAQAASPGIHIASQYANSFSDPAAGKEIAKAQFARGAGIVFHVAGATGQGVNEAALESHRYAVGVDMDQAALYRGTNPRLAAHIVTSVLKNVDVAVLRAIAQARHGELAYGSVDSLGLAEGGISLAMDSDVLRSAPRAVLAALEQARADVVAGRVRVPSAFDAVRTTAR
jgi:basic membrane protein A